MNTKNLRHELPISTIITKYIPLTSRGANFEGICPFHEDTKPSLKVSDSKGIYKCFACGAGGDGINFVMEYKKIPFHEAIEEIADDHNIPIETGPISYKTQAINLLNSIKDLYILEAQKSKSFDLFLEDRNISPLTAMHLEIGYAPSGNILLEELQKKDNYKFELAIELGLIKKSSRGYYDFFRERIIFPICDEKGNCVGFCGRSTNEDQVPKYLNSKESFVFKKGELLYGYHLSKDSILKEATVLVVEGFMDVASLVQHGITNVVATMGTTVSESNIIKLNEIASEIILGLDSDKAGKIARERINHLMLNQGILPYSLDYTPHKDADEYLNKETRASIKLKELMNSSRSLIDVELTELVNENQDSSIEEKERCLKQIFTTLSPLGMSIKATERIINYTKLLGLKTDSKFILENYQKFLNR